MAHLMNSMFMLVDTPRLGTWLQSNLPDLREAVRCQADDCRPRSDEGAQEESD
jgi:hypothetical protein